jgi:hypothetical protein
MTTLELWNKAQHSGINNAPIISNEELILLREKLFEIEEFVTEVNPFSLGMIMNISGIERGIKARGIDII